MECTHMECTLDSQVPDPGGSLGSCDPVSCSLFPKLSQGSAKKTCRRHVGTLDKGQAPRLRRLRLPHQGTDPCAQLCDGHDTHAHLPVRYGICIQCVSCRRGKRGEGGRTSGKPTPFTELVPIGTPPCKNTHGIHMAYLTISAAVYNAVRGGSDRSVGASTMHTANGHNRKASLRTMHAKTPLPLGLPQTLCPPSTHITSASHRVLNDAHVQVGISPHLCGVTGRPHRLPQGPNSYSKL